jgi:hypothetical protein
MLKVRELAPGDLSAFIKFPYRLYKNDPNWVPPLISERRDFFNPTKNPFFQHARVRYFMAYDSGRPVGRVAGILNFAHNEFHDEKIYFFGFFEAENSPEVAAVLMKKIEEAGREEKQAVLRGPANFSSNDEWGSLLEGFDSPPVVGMTYNPPYYNELFLQTGFYKAKDLLAYLTDEENRPPERMIRVAQKVKEKEGVVLRKVRMADFANEVKIVREIYNQAWEKNWGFVPMTDAEFNHAAERFKPMVDPDMVFIAEVEGKPVGFCLSLPDINQVLIRLKGRLFPFGIFKFFWHTKIKRKINTVRTITMGVIPEFRKRGIDNVMTTETYFTGVPKGYVICEMSWVLEDNYMMNRIAEIWGARLYKKYRIWEKNL